MSLITLTSDIGTQDYLVGAIKGQLLQADPKATIVDITHTLSPFNFPRAAYLCRNAIQHFPSGTIHIILVNLFDEKPNHLLLAQHNQQYIACADNGLLTMILDAEPEKVIGLPLSKTTARNTLYCTGVIARAIEGFAQGKELDELGEAGIPIKIKNQLKPTFGSNWIEGQIIFIDNFENVIVNISRDEFEKQRNGRSFTIVFKRDEVIDRISETYADVAEGEKLALFNASGYLEIAINKGNAAGLFGLQGFNEWQQQGMQQHMNNLLFYQTVKVYFE
jgi:S-adenosylmethionine hydrolase